jgi:predicted lipoprotein with Yx(FWY)xxD motif
MNRTNTLIVLAIAGTGLLAACGGDDGSTPAIAAASAPAVASVPPTSTTIAAAGSTVAVKSAESELGPILVGVDGRTLYGFTNDTPIQSNCEGTCAEAWPPIVVPANWTVAPGVDSGIFNTITRSDGTLQLVAGKYPLYAYSGDTAPGDVNGQGSGDVWFVVDTAGSLVEDAAVTDDEATEDEATEDAATEDEATEDTTSQYATTESTEPATGGEAPPKAVFIGETPLGVALTDADGFTLYGFTNDGDGRPTCNDACADAWPPLLVDGDTLPEGLDAAVFSVVQRDDGSHQLKAGKWPLYRFAGDEDPGQTNGQGSGDVWFVVNPDGTLKKG